MAKKMKVSTVCIGALSLILLIMNVHIENDVLLALTITCATITYHLGMRLVVGFIFDKVMKNRADYTKSWYQSHKWELRLYERLNVKKWKKGMPRYQPDLFMPQNHTWDEIAQAMCQAELVHETIVVLSFLPILASIPLGAFWVFLITSVGAAGIDLLFVMMQRYNRPRVVKLALKEQAK